MREVDRQPSGLPLALLVASVALTLLFAWIDALQEHVPGALFVLQVTFGAAVAQLPGLLIAELYRRSGTRVLFVFLVPAFLVAVCSLLAYCICVAFGQLQTVENAAQMHVVFVPILLAMLAFVSYVVTGMAVGIVSIASGRT